MADLVIKADGLKPQDGALVVPATAGEAIPLITPASTIGLDGKLTKTSGASGVCAGLVVSTETKSNAAAANDAVGLLVHGPCGGFTGLVPGRLIFLAATAGKLADTGTIEVGYALTDQIAMIAITPTDSAS